MSVSVSIGLITCIFQAFLVKVKFYGLLHAVLENILVFRFQVFFVGLRKLALHHVEFFFAEVLDGGPKRLEENGAVDVIGLGEAFHPQTEHSVVLLGTN